MRPTREPNLPAVCPGWRPKTRSNHTPQIESSYVRPTVRLKPRGFLCGVSPIGPKKTRRTIRIIPQTLFDSTLGRPRIPVSEEDFEPSGLVSGSRTRIPRKSIERPAAVPQCGTKLAQYFGVVERTGRGRTRSSRLGFHLPAITGL